MSYKKMMKHWNKARRHKLTASRIRGNSLVWSTTADPNAENLARKLKGA